MTIACQTKITKEIEGDFLALLAEGMQVIHASARVGISRQSMYAHRDRKKTFKKAWDEAIEDGRQRKIAKLEDEADRRAVEGVLVGYFEYNGKTHERRRYSDKLLLARLQALDPERYAQRSKVSNEVSGPGGGPVKLQVEIEWVDAEAETEASEEA